MRENGLRTEEWSKIKAAFSVGTWRSLVAHLPWAHNGLFHCFFPFIATGRAAGVLPRAPRSNSNTGISGLGGSAGRSSTGTPS
jgi:hypothetical protein